MTETNVFEEVVPEHDRAILKKILQHISGIYETETEFGENKTLFLTKRIYQIAIVFDVTQIGELIHKLDCKLVNRKELYKIRCIIVHDYDHIDLDRLWNTVIRDVPAMRKEIYDILSL